MKFGLWTTVGQFLVFTRAIGLGLDFLMNGRPLGFRSREYFQNLKPADFKAG
jgi:hypothetical protein